MNTFKIIITTISMLSSLLVVGQQLHLYGGANNKQYLGCLNCNEFSAKSIWNEFGDYGSEFSEKSIWNDFSEYGSEFSSYSPWNEYSSNPPAILDSNGGFYGYLTINEYKSDRATFDIALQTYRIYYARKND